MWAKKEERKDEKKQLEEVEQEARAIEIERKKIQCRTRKMLHSESFVLSVFE